MFRMNVLLFYFKEMCFDMFFSKYKFLRIFSFTYTLDSFIYPFVYNIAIIINDTSIKHYIQTINYIKGGGRKCYQY